MSEPGIRETNDCRTAEIAKTRIALFAALRRSGIAAVEAEDVVQETFLRIETKTATGGAPPGGTFAWLKTVAKRIAIDRRRRARARPLEDESIALTPRADEILERREDLERVRLALDVLDRRDQEVIRLFYGDGRSVAEIAHVTGLGVEAVKSRLHRARLSLATRLKERP